MFTRCLFHALIFGLLTSASGLAEPDKSPARFARLLALGDSPPFRQEIRDGVRYELPPPPGSMPPRNLFPVSNKQAAKPVAIRLGRISNQFPVPAGTGGLDLRTGPDAAPWLQVGRPESGNFMLLVWRAPDAMLWEKPEFLIIPDGPDSSPAGSVRITNLFPQAVRIIWQDEALLLPPNTSIRRNTDPGRDVPFEVLVPNPPGGMKRYFSSTVALNTGERGFITIYRADSPKPRRPLKVLIFREPVRPSKPMPAPEPEPDTD